MLTWEETLTSASSLNWMMRSLGHPFLMRDFLIDDTLGCTLQRERDSCSHRYSSIVGWVSAGVRSRMPRREVPSPIGVMALGSITQHWLSQAATLPSPFDDCICLRHFSRVRSRAITHSINSRIPTGLGQRLSIRFTSLSPTFRFFLLIRSQIPDNSIRLTLNLSFQFFTPAAGRTYTRLEVFSPFGTPKKPSGGAKFLYS